MTRLAEAYPLQWPATWPRSKQRKRNGHFADYSLARARDLVVAELRRHGVGDYNVVISTNLELRRDGLPRGGQAQPDDTGVAVYFRIADKPHVLACDRWHSVEHNLYAIALHIEALRGMERWGVGTAQQAFAGYKALPENAGDGCVAPWRNILGDPPVILTADWVQHRFRELAKAVHPDVGGTAGSMVALFRARDDAMREVVA